ncbi:hypothetical protein SASPL_138118 [Salvia splendens]|uniref:Uncharacterized protein n=1 Tax=Salvia splendens TaxID=180675 RepID=A0A8X8ZE11_SALSN|nr:hypothetical protein SASPL_138118 [Salvia splendens]
MHPLNLLLRSSNLCRSFSCPISVGILPLRLLFPSFRLHGRLESRLKPRYLTWDLSRDLEIQVGILPLSWHPPKVRICRFLKVSRSSSSGHSLAVEASGEEEDCQILAVFECVEGSHSIGEEVVREGERVFGMLPEKVLLPRSRACKCWRLLRRRRVVRLVHFVREGGKVPLREGDIEPMTLFIEKFKILMSWEMLQIYEGLEEVDGYRESADEWAEEGVEAQGLLERWMVIGKVRMSGPKRELKLKSRVREGRRPDRWLWERFMWARNGRFGRASEQVVEGNQLRLTEGDWEEMNDNKEFVVACCNITLHLLRVETNCERE